MLQSLNTNKEFPSFLIYTGSELSLLKKGLLKDSVKIYIDKFCRLIGITKKNGRNIRISLDVRY